MKYIRPVIAFPVVAIGAAFFTIGTVLLMAAHYTCPDMKMFDRWINRVIDGSKT